MISFILGFLFGCVAMAVFVAWVDTIFEREERIRQGFEKRTEEKT